jgi:hypothetical protein
MIKFETNMNLRELETILSNNISPRNYYLHNEIGGEGWRIKDQYRVVKQVVIENDIAVTFIMLQLK